MKREISRKYTFGTSVLGVGMYGKVFLGENKNDKSQKVAIKALSKLNLGKLITSLKQEIVYLRKVDSPNIVKYYETYEDDSHVYLVMEYCPGKELYELITQKVEKSKRFREKEAADLMQKLFKAVAHIHSVGIAHRDIKPQNIIIGEEGELKLIDFGFAQKFVKNNKLDTGQLIGTPQYLAPEAFQGVSSLEVDLWSLGVILCVMLSGSLPYSGSNPYELMKNIHEKPEMQFDQMVWRKVSPEGRDLVRRLLRKIPSKRIKAKDALEHNWFKRFSPVATLHTSEPQQRKSSTQVLGFNRQQSQNGEDNLDPEVIASLRTFSNNTSKLQKTVINVLVKIINDKEIDHLRRQFELVDVNHSGIIDSGELLNAIEAAGITIDPLEVESLIKSINLKGNGEINYSEFIAATISIRQILTQEKLYALFKEFDHQDIEVLTENNIRGALLRMGKDISHEEVDQMLAEHNIQKGGVIDFEQFKRIMLNTNINEQKDTNEFNTEL